MTGILATILLAAAAIALPALALLLRCRRLIGQTAASMKEHHVDIGEGTPWDEGLGRSTTLAAKLIGVILGVVVAILVAALAITYLIEPGALQPLFGVIIKVLGLPAGIALLCVLLAVEKACQVRELFRAVTDSDLPADHPARRAALDLLGRVTWSQAGVTGIGALGAVLCFVFGAGLVGALFFFASAAISCARDPKCI